MMTSPIFAIILFFALLAIAVIVRSRISGVKDIRNTDVALALIPMVLYLFLTGKITKFSIGDLAVESAIKEAFASAVSAQITELTQLPVERLRSDVKGGVERIHDLLRQKTEVLTFNIGYGGYWGPPLRNI